MKHIQNARAFWIIRFNIHKITTKLIKNFWMFI